MSAAISLPESDLTGFFTVPRSPMQKTASMFTNPTQNQLNRDLYDYQQASTTSTEDTHGECASLKLALHFDGDLSLLTVHLLQAVDLIALRQDGPPNPYCRVTLAGLSESATMFQQQTQQSRVYKNSRSPTMNDEFFFDISPDQLHHCKLEVLVYDFDQFSVDESIGYCWLALARLEISTDASSPNIFWAEVLPSQRVHRDDYGEVLFSLQYLSKAQRLTVNVFKARNLAMDDFIEQSAVAIHVSLMSNNEKRRKRKKTSAKRNTSNPNFNESINFALLKNTLCDTILLFEAINEYGTFGMNTKILGRLEVPLHSCKELWRSFIRDEKPEAPARWYQLQVP